MSPFSLTLPVLVLALRVNWVHGSQRFCGKHLSDTLSLVCGGRGFFWQEDKKSGVPFVTKRDSNYLHSREKRSLKTRGIIEECCENPCSISDLEGYCATVAKPTPLSNAEVERVMLRKPVVQQQVLSEDVSVIGSEYHETPNPHSPGSESHETPNPHLPSRMEDLRARLLDGGLNRTRLVSRRPFFFVRPISRRPARMIEINHSKSLPKVSVSRSLSKWFI